MKTIYLTLITALGLSLGINAQDINTSESSLKWYGNEISGKQHYGGLTFKSGSINTSNGKLTGGAFEIDMSSIDVQDLEGEWAEKLEGHLKADDFFGVDNFASAYLILTSVKESANGSFAATGDLTIRGITNPVDVTFTAAGSNKMTAEMTFDRSKYDVKFRSGAFFSDLGDKLILDDIKVEVSLVY